MPEIKHNFMKGKMNKDLDDRLLPNGEYRDALNVQVSKSEASDVGALENINPQGTYNRIGGGDTNHIYFTDLTTPNVPPLTFMVAIPIFYQQR